MKRIEIFITSLICLTSFNAVAQQQPVSLDVFAQLSSYQELKISPTGEYLAAVVRLSGDDPKSSLVVLDIENLQITAVAEPDGDDFIADVSWATDDRVLGWVGNKNNYREAPGLTGDIVAMDADGKNTEWIFGFRKNPAIYVDPNVQGGDMLSRLKDDEDHILLSNNDSVSVNGSYTEAIRVNIHNGRELRVARAPMRNADLIVDENGDVRMAVAENPDDENAITLFLREEGDWRQIASYYDWEGRMWPLDYDAENNRALVMDNRTTDTDSLFWFYPENGEMELIFSHDVVDVELDNYEFNEKGEIIGVYLEDGYPSYEVLDPNDELNVWFSKVRQKLPGHRVQITSTTREVDQAIIYVESDRLPGMYFHYDVETDALKQLVMRAPHVDPRRMLPQEPIKLTMRDGVEIFGYLTRPAGQKTDLPMVVMPHGGPHGVRDYWGYDPDVQALASRGYAVLQMNFRGSGGYGREFLFSGYKRWGLEMQDDVTDSTLWAIEAGIANRDRVCIYGGSYGGYATLMGVVKEPDLYQCGIPYVAVSDLEIMYTRGDIPERESGIVYLTHALGEDKEDLRARSPINHMDKLKADLFIVHGREDVRVPVEHAYRVRRELQERDIPFEWMEKRKEGHGFFNRENRLELYERMMVFLDKHIGAQAAQ